MYSILYKNLYIETWVLVSSTREVVLYPRTGGISDVSIISH
jgi:hypothetical protein